MYLALLALLPVFLILFYVYKRDIDPEPIKTVGITFAFGAVSAIVALPLELVASNILVMLGLEGTDLALGVETLWGVAAIEEVCKWAVIMIYIWNHKDFDDSYDAIVYCVTASLGFAALENLLYVFQNGLEVAILRAVTSIPGHTCFGVFMGFFLAKAKHHMYHNRLSDYRLMIVLSLAVSILVHGIYDFFALSGNIAGLLVIILAMDVAGFIIIQHCFKNDHPMIADKKAVPPPFTPVPPAFNANSSSQSNTPPPCDTE